jgi:hypothetical protein
MIGVSATKERVEKQEPISKVVLAVTLPQGETKLWLQNERQQDSHATYLLFSLHCLKPFDSFSMVALALFFSFCVFPDFSRTMLALALILLFCHTSFCL